MLSLCIVRPCALNQRDHYPYLTSHQKSAKRRNGCLQCLPEKEKKRNFQEMLLPNGHMISFKAWAKLSGVSSQGITVRHHFVYSDINAWKFVCLLITWGGLPQVLPKSHSPCIHLSREPKLTLYSCYTRGYFTKQRLNRAFSLVPKSRKISFR